MSSDHTSELFPIFADGGRDFEVAMRGYDRRQVDEYVSRTEGEITALTAERESAVGRSADLAAQLANAHAQIESVRSRLNESTAQITPDNVHARVRPIVENAQAEARNVRESADAEAVRTRQLADADAFETRRLAAADAERMRVQAQNDLHRATEAAIRREAEADQTLANAHVTSNQVLQRAHTQAEAMLADAHAQADALMTDAHNRSQAMLTDAQTRSEAMLLDAQTRSEAMLLDAQTRSQTMVADSQAEVLALNTSSRATRDRLDAEAKARRDLANEDFEIALRVRRTREQAADDARHAEAVTSTQRLLSETHNEAIRVIAEANARVQQLSDLRDRMHADLGHVNGRVAEVLAASKELAGNHLLARLPGVSGLSGVGGATEIRAKAAGGSNGEDQSAVEPPPQAQAS